MIGQSHRTDALQERVCSSAAPPCVPIRRRFAYATFDTAVFVLKTLDLFFLPCLSDEWPALRPRLSLVVPLFEDKE